VNGAEMIFTPTLIRDTGLENWDVYLKARALENRVPIAACNSVFELPDRKFLGKSKIISFLPGSESPINLKVKEASETPEILRDEIDLDFPNKIRNKRLEEAIDHTTIKIIQK
jgi:predicted amidohydrolase